MLMDSVVKFYREGRKAGDDRLVAEDIANVTDMGIDRTNQLIGNINQRSLVVRTLHSVEVGFSYLTINDGDKHYRLTTRRDPLKGNTLIVGEDVGS